MRVYPRPDARGTSGKISAVHAQIAVVALIVVGQLWLLTIAWDLLMSGNTMGVVTSTIVSALGFLLSVVTLLGYREQ